MTNTIENRSLTLLRDQISTHKEYLDVLLQEPLGILCINRTTKKSRSIPFKALYDNNNHFWLQNGTWEYYLTGENLAIIGDKADSLKAGRGLALPEAGKAAANPGEGSPENGYGKDYDTIAAMPEADRIQLLGNNKKRLDALIVAKPRNEEVITRTLVDISRDAALINQVTLLDAVHLADDEAKKHTQNLVDSTHALVKSSSQLITPNIFNDELMNTLVSKSNGTIIQHMTRVFLNGLAFLTYYNKLVSGSSIINKLRISFDKRHRDFYLSLLPYIPPANMDLERVFLGGMRAIPEQTFFNWATGFLIHDIGKASAVEYHEGEAAYNRDIVVEHVKVGYTSVMNKTNYPPDAGLITGFHHEYYGDPGGYGYYRSLWEQYKKDNPSMRQYYFISYDPKPVQDFQTLSYFPAKILEMIDVYDSVTDPNRKYRKALSPEEALAMMQEEFIEKHPKIDLILFEIFSAFVRDKANQK